MNQLFRFAWLWCALSASAMSLSAKVSLELYGTKVPATVSNLMYAGSNGNKSYFLAVTEKVGCEILTFDRVSGRYESYSPPELAKGKDVYSRIYPMVFSIGDKVFVRSSLEEVTSLWSFDMAHRGMSFQLELRFPTFCFAPKGGDFFSLETAQSITIYDEDVEKIGEWDPKYPEDRHAQERFCQYYTDAAGMTYLPRFTYIDNKTQRIGMSATDKKGSTKYYDLEQLGTKVTRLLVEPMGKDTLAAYTYYSSEGVNNHSTQGDRVASVCGISVSLLDTRTARVIAKFDHDLNSLFGRVGSAYWSKGGNPPIFPRRMYKFWDGYLVIGEEGVISLSDVLVQGPIHVCYLDKSLNLRWSIEVPKRAYISKYEYLFGDFRSGYSFLQGSDRMHFIFEDVAPVNGLKDPKKAEPLNKILDLSEGGVVLEPFRFPKFAVLMHATIDQNGKVEFEKVPGSETHDFMIDHTSTLQSGPGEITTMVRLVKSGGYQLARIRVD